VVGTAPTAHIRLKHDSIAGRQLLISQNPTGDILIDDLCAGKKATILLNGLKIRKANIVYGDVVSVGPFDIHIGAPKQKNNGKLGTMAGFSDATAATRHQSYRKNTSNPRTRNASSSLPRTEGKDDLALDRVSQSLKSLLQSPQEPTNQQARPKKILPSPLAIQPPVRRKKDDRKPMFGDRNREERPKVPIRKENDSPFKSQHSAIEAQISSIENRTGDKSVIISLSDLHDSTLVPELGYYTDGQLVSVRKLESGVSIRVPPDQFCLLRQHGNGKISVFFDSSVSGTIIRNNAVYPIAQGSLNATVFDRQKHINSVEVLPRDIVQILRGRDNYLLRFVKPGSGSVVARSGIEHDDFGNDRPRGRRAERRRRRRWPVLLLLTALLGIGAYQFLGTKEKNSTAFSIAKLKESARSGYHYVRKKIGMGKQDIKEEIPKTTQLEPEIDDDKVEPEQNAIEPPDAIDSEEANSGVEVVNTGRHVAVLQINVESGNVSKFDVESLMTSREDEITECFTSSKSSKGRVTPTALSSRFFVMEDGTVGAATIEAASAKNSSLVNCVLESLRESILDTKPGDISEVTVALLHPAGMLEDIIR